MILLGIRSRQARGVELSGSRSRAILLPDAHDSDSDQRHFRWPGFEIQADYQASHQDVCRIRFRMIGREDACCRCRCTEQATAAQIQAGSCGCSTSPDTATETEDTETPGCGEEESADKPALVNDEGDSLSKKSREFRGPVELSLALVAEWDGDVVRLLMAA